MTLIMLSMELEKPLQLEEYNENLSELLKILQRVEKLFSGQKIEDINQNIVINKDFFDQKVFSKATFFLFSKIYLLYTKDKDEKFFELCIHKFSKFPKGITKEWQFCYSSIAYEDFLIRVAGFAFQNILLAFDQKRFDEGKIPFDEHNAFIKFNLERIHNSIRLDKEDEKEFYQGQTNNLSTSQSTFQFTNVDFPSTISKEEKKLFESIFENDEVKEEFLKKWKTIFCPKEEDQNQREKIDKIKDILLKFYFYFLKSEYCSQNFEIVKEDMELIRDEYKEENAKLKEKQQEKDAIELYIEEFNNFLKKPKRTIFDALKTNNSENLLKEYGIQLEPDDSEKKLNRKERRAHLQQNVQQNAQEKKDQFEEDKKDFLKPFSFNTILEIQNIAERMAQQNNSEKNKNLYEEKKQEEVNKPETTKTKEDKPFSGLKRGFLNQK